MTLKKVSSIVLYKQFGNLALLFKPIIYAAAINEGYSPSSIIIDSPIIFKEKQDAFLQVETGKL
ncbi:MAG: hypothetical protein CM1200mP16_05880 [Nitrospina sp.]|nr:MAG: hypothetical protein CM1200mP16_05880 [Nitrospina sp.]